MGRFPLLQGYTKEEWIKICERELKHRTWNPNKEESTNELQISLFNEIKEKE